jgi:prolyl-tRNA editing enzyme YbaK/EbsC (Cys-tRNA(Pro) deacylase)
MTEGLPKAAGTVVEAARSLGLDLQVREFPEGTRTAQDAANAIGCAVDQIVKSLVFRLRDSGRALLVVTSGAHRVDEQKVAALVGEPIERADADFVRTQTGFAIGGVAPVGHANPLRTLIDADLFQHTELWAAAGTPHAVFPLTPTELRRLAPGAITVELKRE